MRKVLIANRGEIAVRVARACRDAGLVSVAVYTDPDREAAHVRAADEAYAITGRTPVEAHLDIAGLIRVAVDSGADAVHPGYGFLAENAAFAAAVIDAGLTWIGPPPAAIETLGDKVRAREIATAVGAPLAAGTPGPVSGPDELVAFAARHGLPIAIKAAFGGGGRGLKVAHTMREIPARYESAVREAVAAFGRGECFGERYLDRPRHVETQCLADRQGHVVVVSTRDCSLQRRHQKLVEEAPAPFLTEEQDALLRSSSKAILRAGGYVGAATCEFLIGRDGTMSFLEVNTRLQVEHPVTEEVTGIDLVREMFRIADGEEIGYDDPPAWRHSLEFRINAEDPGAGFVPAAGPLAVWRPPEGPGVRLDSGYSQGDVVPPGFDSLIAKLVVTGANRREAVARARRALAEFEIAGVPTLLPFHRAVLHDEAFTGEPFTVHTRWIEEFAGAIAPQPPPDVAEPPAERSSVVVEVDGKRVEVSLPAALPGAGVPAVRRLRRRVDRGRSEPAAGGTALVAPMQGTVVTIAVEEGQPVAAGDPVVVLEAMKMEQPVTAHRAGVVANLAVEVGGTVGGGGVICEIR